MDTAAIVLIIFFVGLIFFLLTLRVQDAKEDGRSVLDAVLDFVFLAWVLGESSKE